VIAVAALAVAIAVAIIVFSMPIQKESDGPTLKFTEFTPDRRDIKVGESTKILFNVQNLVTRSITDAQVVIVIEPSGYQSYLTIQNQTVQLPDLYGRDARTGQMQVVISAAGAPAKEAVYTVKGLLFVEGNQSDVREFELRVRQQ
jgi:pectin methylesterase-like acyl-CoA thioesterase